MLVGAALALLPLAGLGVYLLVRAFGSEDPVSPGPTPPPVISSKPPGEGTGASTTKPPDKPTTPKSKPIGVSLRSLAGNDDIAARWNDLAAQFNSARDPIEYPSWMDDLRKVLQDSKGSPWEDPIKAGFGAVVRAMAERAEQIFVFLSDESKRLADNGRFGDAIKSYDWFPGKLDGGGTYARRIDDLKVKLRETGGRAYQAKRTLAEACATDRQFDKAKLHMLEALEMGLPEVSDDAYKLIAKFTTEEDKAGREAELKEMAEMAAKARGERDVNERVLTVRGQFWQIVSKRAFETVPAFFAQAKNGAPEAVAREVSGLEKAFAAIKAGFGAVESSLAGQTGRQVTVSFIDGVRALQLKSASGGVLTYTREGRDFAESVYRVSVDELRRAAEAQKTPERRDFVLGVAELMGDNWQAAHASLSRARDEGAAILAFVENSSAFLAKNAPEYRQRAQKHMDAKQWDQAVAEWSRLVDLKEERAGALKGRARCHFNTGNFVGTVLDIEQLFEGGDFSAETVDLLSQAYQRARMLTKAIELFQKALTKNPGHGKVLGALARLYVSTHRWAEARALLERVEKIEGFTAELAQVVNEIRNYRENPFAGTQYKAPFGRYDVETNVSQEFANKTAQMMDRVYREYQKVFPFKKNESLRFKVLVFATDGEFQAYGGGALGGPTSRTLAFYSPLRKELVGWAQPPADFEETMTHEGLHQYIDYYVDDCPIWFNEGYASYFEKSTAEQAKFNKERWESAYYLLRMRRLPSLKDLFLMDRGKFRDEGALHYGSSWAAIYYLNKTGRKELLDRYFAELMQGKTQQQAYDAVFAKVDLVSIESGWRRAIDTSVGGDTFDRREDDK